jgi:hypothetical protein
MAGGAAGAGGGGGNGGARPGGGPSEQGPGPAVPRPVPFAVDPSGIFRGMVRQGEPPPQAVAASAARSAAMHFVLTDLVDPLDLVEVTGDLSFLESDSLLTAREFAALLTNTKPRADVVPQQGSSVASVATLMPSDRPEATDPVVVNELAPLLIDPLDKPSPAPASAGTSDSATAVDSDGP